MKTILLMAYSISPTKGSEFSVGWNFVTRLAEKNKVIVLSGASGDHLGDTFEIEDYFKKKPNKNIKLHIIRPTKLVSFINWFNKIGLWPMFYLAYQLWQKKAYQIAKEIVGDEKVDVVHQLNPIGFREPGYLWKLNLPFVWGPIGGAVTIPESLLVKLPSKLKLLFKIKNKVNLAQLRYGRRPRLAAAKAMKLIFCNSENKINFEKYLNVTGPVISEQGAFERDEFICVDKNNTSLNGCLSFVWAGTICYRKNLSFILEALACVSDSNWILNVIGEGPLLKSTRELADELGISDNIIWHGKLSRLETINIIGAADLHLMASLAEGNPAVLYEAISLGVPTLSLDKDGMHDTLSKGNGILVKVSGYETTLQDYSLEIQKILLNRDCLDELKNRTNNMFSHVSWATKISTFEDIYAEAINSYNR